MRFRNLKLVGGLLKAQVFNYFYDPVNIMLGFVLTVFTMWCWISFKKIGSDVSVDKFVLASAIGISAIRNSQYNLNLTLSEWRSCRFIRNILTTPVSKRLLYFSILLFNWILNIIVATLLIALAMIDKEQRLAIRDVQWPQFIVGLILNVLLSNIMAILISNLIKNRDYVAIVSGLSYFLPMYLMGLGIPWSTVGNYRVINYITYFFPHRYTIHIMQAAWVGKANDMGSSFPPPYSITSLEGTPEYSKALEDWNNTFLGKNGFGYDGMNWWFPAVICIGIMLVMILIIIVLLNKNYKFGYRKYAKYKGVSSHLNNINMIKNANSILELKNYIEIAQLDQKSKKSKSKQILKKNGQK